MAKKYLILPRFILSKNDNDYHYISAQQLIMLYGVNPNECLIWSEDAKIPPPTGLIHLSPDYHGNYKISEES